MALQHSLRAVDVANIIRLNRSQHRGAFWVVEGRDDRLLFGKFVNRKKCNIEVAMGKSRVLEVIQILDQSQFEGVMGSVDSDFDRLEGRQVEGRNVFYTDLHDLECMLIRSAAFDGLLKEFGNQEKLQKFGQDVRESLAFSATPIGCLRLYSERDGLNLRFDGLSYRNFIDRDSLEVDRNALVRNVKNFSQRPDLSDDLLLEKVDDIEVESHDPWQICVGTDLLGILSIGLRKALGSNNAADVQIENLRRALRLAYRHTDFSGTELHRQIRAWEKSNSPFQVLEV